MSNIYRKKTVEFQAVQNTRENTERLDSFLDEHGASFERLGRGLVVLYGDIHIPVGKWLIRWSNRDWSVVSPSIFERHYEPCDQEQEEEGIPPYDRKKDREQGIPSMGRKMMPGVDVVVLRGYQKDRYGVVLEEQQSSHYVRYVLLDGEGEGEEFLISDLALGSRE